MERKRIDLAGGMPAATTQSAKAAPTDAMAAEKRKNLILAAVGTLLLLGAAYLIYANFFAIPGPPADAATPEAQAVFDEAGSRPPPEQDSQPMPEPGIGKVPG